MSAARQLEWVREDEWFASVDAFDWFYAVRKVDQEPIYKVIMHGVFNEYRLANYELGPFSNVDEAKEAAQSDFASRINQCLSV